MALVIFRDSRWQDGRSIIATMEVDLTKGSQLIYVIPDIMMTMGDFFWNIQLSILSKGYESWRNWEANLLITRGMIGRLSNTPNVAFAYEVSGVVDYLTSHSVNALPRRRYSTSQLQGMNWIIRPTQINFPMQPAEVSSRNLIDDRRSISFQNYVTAPSANQDEAVSSNEEEIWNYILAILIKQYIQIQVKKLTPTAIIPRRYSDEVVGYDLSSDETVTIEPRGRSLISTEVAIMIPKGFYDQIATRSNITSRLGVHVRVGVIDSDYQVMEFTTTTIRADKGFGSTNYPLTEELTQQLLPHSITQPEISLPYEGLAYCQTSRDTHAGATSPRATILRSMDYHLNQDNTSANLTDYIRDYCVVEDDGDWDDEFFVSITDTTLEEEEKPWDMEYLQLD
ncbi:hypothetical protein ZIOFF_070097 [Zingiber officinale]|uniref:Deoxyuridine 5'-triphosphate nucleotidohydrolase n=1 Tax=Zingiber officinale TaxID=94328 RepID=A0A8J5C6Z1_ZINOF|nr:hypothetical protein ZIOFF_070097 [Zingiber officinale]